MLVDLLSRDNYVSFNILLADKLGLHAAIYLSALIDIQEKVVRKNKFVDGEYFKIDRKYITSRTTLTKDEQKEIENLLDKENILSKHKNDSDIIKLDCEMLTTIAMTEDEQLIKNVKLIAETTRKKTRSEREYDLAVEAINKTLPESLIEAYTEWVKSVYNKEKRIVSATVVLAQDTISKFCIENGKLNVDKALKVIAIATSGGYRDMNWAIDRFIKDYKNVSVTPPINNSPISLSMEGF